MLICHENAFRRAFYHMWSLVRLFAKGLPNVYWHDALCIPRAHRHIDANLCGMGTLRSKATSHMPLPGFWQIGMARPTRTSMSSIVGGRCTAVLLGAVVRYVSLFAAACTIGRVSQ